MHYKYTKLPYLILLNCWLLALGVLLSGQTALAQSTSTAYQTANHPKAMMAKATALTGKVDTLAKLVEELALKVRKEAGNIEFTVFRSQDDPATFRMIEIYRNDQAFDEHLHSDYVQAFNHALKQVAVNGTSEVTPLDRFAVEPTSADQVRAVDHIGLTVPDIEQSSTFFEKAFGAVQVYDVQRPDQKPMAGKSVENQLGVPQGAEIIHMRLMRIGDGPTLEIFQFDNTEQKDANQLNDFGWQHAAFYVDDIQAIADQLEQAGATLLSSPHALAGVEAGDHNAGVYARTPWGMLVELITYPDGIDYNEDATTTRWTPALLVPFQQIQTDTVIDQSNNQKKNTMIKMTMFLKRNPDLSHEEFVKHHIEQHGPLFRQIPGVEDHVIKYIQTHPVKMKTDAVSLDNYDGTAELWFDSQEGMEAVLTSDFYKEKVFPDEKTFLDHEHTLITVGDVVTIISE